VRCQTDTVHAGAARCAYASPRVESASAADGPAADLFGAVGAAQCERTAVADRTVSLRRRAGIREYSIDRETLLFDAEARTLHHLNETAYFLWRCCDGRSIDDLSRALIERYKIAPDSATDHVKELFESLWIARLFDEEPPHATRT
jgi:hypothetical protein